MQQSEEEDSSSVEEALQKMCQMGNLQLLNNMETWDSLEAHTLLFVNVEIRGHFISALVDTGPTHNFMSTKGLSEELCIVIPERIRASWRL